MVSRRPEWQVGSLVPLITVARFLKPLGLLGVNLHVLPAGPMSSPSAAGLIWPLDGILSSGFGPRSSPGGIGSTYHEGIDISVPEGTPIRAAASGTVIMASYNGGYGNYTCVDHGSGLSTCYAHQSGFAVSSGQSVDQGQVIGYSGNTGASGSSPGTGPGQSFERRDAGFARSGGAGRAGARNAGSGSGASSC